MRGTIRQITALFPHPGAVVRGMLAALPWATGCVVAWIRAQPAEALDANPKGKKARKAAQQARGQAAARTWGTLAALALLAYAIGRYPDLGWLLLIAWIIAGFALAPAREDHATLGEGRDLSPEQEAEPALDNPAPLRALVEQLTAAGAAGHLKAKGRGVPVDNILTELQENGSQVADTWGRAEMIAELQRGDLPVKEQMKFTLHLEDGTKKRINVLGVHVGDLTAALGNTPRLPAHLVATSPPPSPTSPWSRTSRRPRAPPDRRRGGEATAATPPRSREAPVGYQEGPTYQDLPTQTGTNPTPFREGKMILRQHGQPPTTPRELTHDGLALPLHHLRRTLRLDQPHRSRQRTNRAPHPRPPRPTWRRPGAAQR